VHVESDYVSIADALQPNQNRLHCLPKMSTLAVQDMSCIPHGSLQCVWTSFMAH